MRIKIQLLDLQGEFGVPLGFFWVNLWDFHQDVRENLFKTLMGKANELVSAWQEEIDEAKRVFGGLVFGLLGFVV